MTNIRNFARADKGSSFFSILSRNTFTVKGRESLSHSKVTTAFARLFSIKEHVNCTFVIPFGAS